MKCARCGTELPGQAQFCLRCGTPVTASAAASAPAVAAERRPYPQQPTGAYPAASAPLRAGERKSRAGLYGGIAAVVLLLILAALFGRNLLNRGAKAGPGNNVVNTAGRAPDGANPLQSAGRINTSAPLARAGQAGPPPVDTTSIVDYLAFLKEIERERITLAKRDSGAIMTMIPMVEGGNLMGEMQDNEADIQRAHQNTYRSMQQTIANISGEWDALAAKFNSRRPPQACAQLATSYYGVLQNTSSAIVAVSTSFSQAMQGLNNQDPGRVSGIVQQLKGMDGSGMGSPSKAVDDACNAADTELGRVCDKYHIHKDFDIKPDGGGSSNPFGMGG